MRAGDFISESSFEDVKSYWQSLGIDFFMYERGDHISLSQIVVPKTERSAGLGTKAMQKLVAYADAAGKTITLTPSSDFGGSKTRLVDFYRRFGFVPNKGRNKDFRYSDSMIRTPKSATAISETRQPGEYVYHASYVGDNKAQWLRSLIQRGLQPSKEGYSGPGTYFAYEPDEGYYHVTPEDSMILRVRWADLAKLYGVYPQNPNGIERDDDEIIVPGAVPGNILEVEYFEDEWWDLKSALSAETYQYENIEEAETGTKFARNVSSVMRKAGYKKLGSGADATVWARESGSVVKIIMPEDGGTGAAKTFKRFVDFCNEHKNVPNLPKFTPVDQEISSKLNFEGEQYIYFAMERLQPIKSGSFEEAMVWILSDLAAKNMTWEKAYAAITKPNTWRLWDDGLPAEQIIQQLKAFGPQEQAEYGLLFTIMVLLYKTGRINKLGWDLHTENVMQRADGTLVIVDPWFAIGTED